MPFPPSIVIMATTSNKQVIFRVEYGGLGAHLFYSALPRLLKAHRLADEVLISDRSRYRNPAIFDLVWRNHPYLDGVSADPPTPLRLITESQETKIVNIIFEGYGLWSPEEFPVEIHQSIETSPTFDDHFIDLNYVSYVGAFTPIDKLDVYQRHPDHVMVNPDRFSRTCFPRRRKVFTKSLQEYACLIASARSFVTLTSGGRDARRGPEQAINRLPWAWPKHDLSSWHSPHDQGRRNPFPPSRVEQLLPAAQYVAFGEVSQPVRALPPPC